MHTRLDLAVALVAAAALGGLSVGASAQVTSPKEDHDAAADHAAIAPAKTVSGRDYSPSAGRKYPMHVYFGDTHHHTANSGDAFFAGNRLTPEDAYRFARGEEIVSSSGVPDRLSRPLDFLVVSDHAEGLGVGYEVYAGNPALVGDPAVARWQKMLKAGGKEAKDAQNELTSAQAQGTLPKPLTDPAIVGPVVKTVWQAYTATADKYNQPGVFTAMIGYEWTSVPGGNNLHRNVLFRDNKDKADQIIPVLGVAERRPGEALGVDGEVRAEDRRQDAGDSAQPEPVQRADVCRRGRRGQAAHRGLRAPPRAVGAADRGDADQGQQRNAPDLVAERRIRRLRQSRAGTTAT